MTKTDTGLGFAYSIGRVRVLERRLVDANVIDRMVGSKDAKEALRILNETEFSTHVADVEHVDKFQEAIEHGLTDAKTTLAQISPSQSVLRLLWFEYDIHNIKALLRGKWRDLEVTNLLNLGSIDVEKLQKFITEGDKSTCLCANSIEEEEIKRIIEGAIEVYEKTESIQIADLYLDKARLELSFQIVEAHGNEFLSEYIKEQIDLENIDALLRIKQIASENSDSNEAKQTEEMFDTVFIANGTVEKRIFTRALDADLSAMTELFKATKYSKIVANGLEIYEKTKSLAGFEKAATDHKIEFLQRAKFVNFGPEPLIAYFWAVQNNAKIIRLIMTAKINNVPAEKIREHLHNIYA